MLRTFWLSTAASYQEKLSSEFEAYRPSVLNACPLFSSLNRKRYRSSPLTNASTLMSSDTIPPCHPMLLVCCPMASQRSHLLVRRQPVSYLIKSSIGSTSGISTGRFHEQQDKLKPKVHLRNNRNCCFAGIPITKLDALIRMIRIPSSLIEPPRIAECMGSISKCLRFRRSNWLANGETQNAGKAKLRGWLKTVIV